MGINSANIWNISTWIELSSILLNFFESNTALLWSSWKSLLINSIHFLKNLFESFGSHSIKNPMKERKKSLTSVRSLNKAFELTLSSLNLLEGFLKLNESSNKFLNICWHKSRLEFMSGIIKYAFSITSSLVCKTEYCNKFSIGFSGLNSAMATFEFWWPSCLIKFKLNLTYVI